jgi:hypothetical protein
VVGGTISFDMLSFEECQSRGRLDKRAYRILSRRAEQDSDQSFVHIGIVNRKLPKNQACAILKSLNHYFH